MEEEQQHPHTEDWCFVCKDGGDLLLCDYENCPKVYHSQCLGKVTHSAPQTQHTWSCDWHCCSICRGTPEVYCLCCPESFCRSCIQFVQFAQLRHDEGLCTECWGILLFAEKLPSPNLKNKRFIDFEDRDTYECLLKEYWEIVKQKEGLTRADLVLARPMGHPIIRQHNSDEPRNKINNSDTTLSFQDWGSKPLIHFLTSIGMDVTNQLTQCDVSSIILKYIQDRDLIHPSKQNKFICDKKLHALFRKKTLPIKQIDVLLKSHFSDNLQRDNHGNKRCSELERSGNKQQQEITQSFGKQNGYFASVVTDNMKLVYLRRSLVEDLLNKQPESFEDKVVGSFIKIDSKGKNPQQLLQVIGVKKMSSTDELNGRNVVLHVCTLADIQISMLSDSDLTEEDCEDLRENIAKGLLERPTVEEIKRKAQILHQDIMKRWIERELVNLQNRIDRANEKGRRVELYQLIEQREKLKEVTEQQRLLKQLPTVIAAMPTVSPHSLSQSS